MRKYLPALPRRAYGYGSDVARRAEEPIDPAVVVTNPEDDCTPEGFAAFLAELLAGPERQLDSLDATEALRELRS